MHWDVILARVVKDASGLSSKFVHLQHIVIMQKMAKDVRLKLKLKLKSLLIKIYKKFTMILYKISNFTDKYRKLSIKSKA